MNKRLFYAVELATILAGAAIPVVNLSAVKDAYLAGVLSAIFGSVVVVAAAVGKLFKFHDNWLDYRALVEALARINRWALALQFPRQVLNPARRECVTWINLVKSRCLIPFFLVFKTSLMF